MDDYATEMEAIEEERQHADFMQAEYEREGREHDRRERRMKALRADGKLAAAAAACPHSGGYPLDSPAAEYAEDPGKGESGYRCADCGSRLSASPWDGGTVTVACEVRP